MRACLFRCASLAGNINVPFCRSLEVQALPRWRRNWSLLARRVRAFTAGLQLCPDELKVWINPVALIRQELVFGERRPQVAQSRRLRRGETGTFLAAQAIDSHMLLELELLLLVPVTSCSEYTVVGAVL